MDKKQDLVEIVNQLIIEGDNFKSEIKAPLLTRTSKSSTHWIIHHVTATVFVHEDSSAGH